MRNGDILLLRQRIDMFMEGLLPDQKALGRLYSRRVDREKLRKNRKALVSQMAGE